jgi:hypothetical protein
MTYLITEKNGRWLIYAGNACILDCEDEKTALATVAAATTLLQQPDCGTDGAAFISRSPRADAPPATTAVARYG